MARRHAHRKPYSQKMGFALNLRAQRYGFVAVAIVILLIALAR
jgi:hypothetical protein